MKKVPHTNSYCIDNNINITNIMKTTKLLITCFFCCTVCSCSNAKNDTKQNAPEWVPLSAETREKVVTDYVEALDKFAQVMPKFGSDTESQWAADTVHAMAASVKQNHSSFLQSYAMISQMQNYTGYGMVYFNAIIGTYAVPDLAGYALRIIPLSDSLYCQLEEAKFEDVRLLSRFNLQSIYNMHLFNTLNRINTDQPADREIASTMYAWMAMDSIANMKEYFDKDIFKISTILEGYASFQMVYPLLRLFSCTEENLNSHISIIVEAAKHFDSQSTPIFQTIGEGRKISVMSDAEFEEWMIAATEHKVKLLKLLTKFVKEWSLTERNSTTDN